MKKFLTVAACFTLISCSAIYNRTYNSDLKVNTKLSRSITLDPVSPNERTFWVDIKNSSSATGLNLQADVLDMLKARGFKYETDPAKAHYWLQANVLRAEKVSDASLNKFSSSLAQGAMVGGVGGALASDSGGVMALGALGGAALAGMLDYSSQNIKYAVLVDVVVSEKLPITAQESSQQKIDTGSSGGKTISYSRDIERNKYSVSILSTAEKVNLTMEEALPEMRKQIAASISNIL